MKNFLNKKPIIKFASSSKVYFEILKKSSATVPDWYKDAEKWFGGKIDISASNPTFKLCAPFLESMISGYTMILPTDIIVKQTEFGPNISWRGDEEIVSIRDHTKSGGLPTPSGYHNNHFTWKNFACFNVPKGYSYLFTHPLNHLELPFFTLSGIVDGDFTSSPQANLPFFLKNNFEGIIEQGTPVAQIIPFKNEEWSMVYDEKMIDEGEKNYHKSNSLISGWYKKQYWRKKIW
jgi:hypothetical protein